MAANTTPGLQIRATEQCISASRNISNMTSISFSFESKRKSFTDFRGSSYISLSKPIDRSKLTPIKFEKMATKAMSGASEQVPVSGLPIDLRGKRAFIAGIADDNGYGWAIAKSLAAAGAEILVGTWVPALNIFETSLRRGKFDDSRVLPDGSLMEITKVYPLDAVFDSPEDVPEDVKTNKRYAGSSKWTVKEVAECVKQDFGTIDILVHSLANGPEVHYSFVLSLFNFPLQFLQRPIDGSYFTAEANIAS
ncbi:enoyl-[acyl-carrier-protein] reductase [nadh] 2, chloroplastic [Nicotiana attenuata]|uniref:Enoyl-[acyl-carrier-protein] reductase [nadh] 2, chloroplastic n=1 Tax=Nicotiana attenuata TaxID=49451 RepID=A0A1J6KCX3_NICAT|nr:enoyl-[acyl-carrier-protein] reductase [nadh] 2, chloroplastic [Nicotiana attenuata]